MILRGGDQSLAIATSRSGLSRAARLATLVLIVVTGPLYALTQLDSGVVGSNGLRPSSFVGKLDAGDELCQGLGVATRRPTLVQITLGLEGEWPQPLRTRLHGRRPFPVMRRYRDGVVSFPLSTAPATKGAVFCLANLGARPLNIAGEAVSGAIVNGEVKPFAVSYVLVAERRRWSDRTAEVFERIGFARGELSGGLVVVLTGLFALGGLIVTLVTTWCFLR